jgi:hypothetical protein
LKFVINPDPYLLPAYRISPFSTSDISLNLRLKADSLILDYFDERFGKNRYRFTTNGREAIHLALIGYNLQKDDVVTILTTSGNHYISSCVTSEIEQFCKWSRKIQDRTRVIFINHEFGFPFQGLREFKSYGLPIIEDCAHSFFSLDDEGSIGKTGDFVIYSFPKMFPIQIGGLLVNNSDKVSVRSSISKAASGYIRNVLSNHIRNKQKIIESRIHNYRYLEQHFVELDLPARFEPRHNHVPGVFMFSVGGSSIDLNELKEYYYSHGVQCSVFYGEKSFFIPVHQALNKNDLDYFIEVMRSFIQCHL